MLSALQLLGAAQQRGQGLKGYGRVGQSVLTSPLTPLRLGSGPDQSRSQQGSHLKGGQSWSLMCDQALTLWLGLKNCMVVLTGLYIPPCWGWTSALCTAQCRVHHSSATKPWCCSAKIMLTWGSFCLPVTYDGDTVHGQIWLPGCRGMTLSSHSPSLGAAVTDKTKTLLSTSDRCINRTTSLQVNRRIPSDTSSMPGAQTLFPCYTPMAKLPGR